MAFDESGFTGMFDMMNPQGQPLELASMAAHQPEGLIPQLASEGITPKVFETRYPELFGTGSATGFGDLGGLSTGQLLGSLSGRFPQFAGADVGTVPGTSPEGGAAPLLPTPVRTQSFTQGPTSVGPAGTTSPVPAEAPAPAETPPGYADKPKEGDTKNKAAMDARAQAEMQKKISDLTKMLAAVKAPESPKVEIPRPGTVGPPRTNPIAQQSAVAALLQQALGQQRAGPTLGGVIRR